MAERDRDLAEAVAVAASYGADPETVAGWLAEVVADVADVDELLARIAAEHPEAGEQP
jgi:hypothetical protein